MRSLLVLLLTIGAVVISPAPAWAEASSSNTANVSVGPMTNGPTMSQGSAGFNPTGTTAGADSHSKPTGAAPAPGSSGTPGGTSDITFRQIPYNAVPSGGFWVDQNGTIHTLPSIPVSACPPGQTGFYTYDATGAPLGVVCVGNGAPPAAGAPAPSPLELAQQASAAQPWPVLQWGTNPTNGLTGLPSWFWLNGNPQMPDATASAGPLTVRVHAALVEVIWHFGDGVTLSSGSNVGQPFPTPSGIRHVYETDSFGRSGGYGLSALLRYEVTFSVNGGPFSVLGAKARSFVTSYQVNQLQPQAVSGS